MLCLAFDTETTGLVQRDQVPGTPGQPDIVQIAAILFDENAVYSTLNFVVIPDKEIEPRAFEAHGIDLVTAKRVGVSRRAAVAMFNNFLKNAEQIVAHNIDFDLSVVKTAYIREGFPTDEFHKKRVYCTMKSSTNICQIPSPKKPGSYKWPTMMEAYKHFVDLDGFDDAHDALADTRACVAVYRKLQEHDRDRAG